MDVLSLLRSKNRCLHKFLEASTEFLDQAGSGQLPDVTMLESRRESILKAIDLYDRKISEAISLLAPEGQAWEPTREALAEGVRGALNEKTALVHQILLLDDQILALIDAEKNKILKELSSTQKSEDIARKFRSTWVLESGEGIDEKL